MMKKWKCTVCDYIHTGDAPPDICPVCGVGAEKFVLLEEKSEKVDLQKVLYNTTYGLYVITSKNDDKINGMVANSFIQITSSPFRGLVGINKDNLTRELILESGVFAVSFLGTDNHFEVKRFGYNTGRNIDKFRKLDYKISDNVKCPVLNNSIGYVECEIEKENCIDFETHTLSIAKIIGGEILDKKEPMTYAYYRKTK